MAPLGSSWTSKTLLILALLVSALSLAFVVGNWRHGRYDTRLGRDICAFVLAFLGCAYWTILLPFVRVPRARVIAEGLEAEEKADDEHR